MRAQQNSIDAKMSRLNKTSIIKFILILKTNNFMLNFMVESLKKMGWFGEKLTRSDIFMSCILIRYHKVE